MRKSQAQHRWQAMGSKSGFTLLEMAMVLIIIGLIAGGILVGRNLIQLAEIRAQMTQVESIDTSINAFRSKYNCLPGDCDNAADLGLADDSGAGEGGDGDGLITPDITALGEIQGPEISNFWFHLGASGLIEGNYAPGNVPGINSPPLKMRGRGMSGNSAGGLWMVPTVSLNARFLLPAPVDSWVMTSRTFRRDAYGVYLPDVARMMDAKMDDELPTSGRVRSINGPSYGFYGSVTCDINDPDGCYGYTAAGTSQIPNSCVDDENFTETRYNLNYSQVREATLCAVVVRASFAP